MSATTRGYSLPTQAMHNGDYRGLLDAQGRQLKIYDPWTTNPTTWERQQLSYNGQVNMIDPARQSPMAKYLFQHHAPADPTGRYPIVETTSLDRSRFAGGTGPSPRASITDSRIKTYFTVVTPKANTTCSSSSTPSSP